jgi:hypothetical protein
VTLERFSLAGKKALVTGPRGASARSSRWFMTGQVLAIDGGQTSTA